MSRRGSEWTILAGAVLIAIAGYLVLWFGIKPSVFHRSRTDFGTFYRAGRMVLAGDGPCVYDLVAEGRYDNTLGTTAVDAEGRSVSLPFVFAPFTLALYALLALLPYRQAEATWYAVNVVMLLALPLVLRKRRAIGMTSCTLGLILPLLFLPVVLALLQGQPSILILLLLALGDLNLADGKHAPAGCWLALASIKPQLILPLLLAILVWRKKETLAGFAATSCGLCVVSFAIVGWRTTLRYPHALLQYASMGGRVGGEHPAGMPNLRGFLFVALHDYLRPALLQKITLAISLLVLAAMALLFWQYRRIAPVSFSLLVSVTLLTSYHSYLHDDSPLLLPLLLTGSVCLKIPDGWLRWMTGAAGLAIFIVPLLPTSLHTTALQMFLAITALAGLLACQLIQEGPKAAASNLPEPSLPAELLSPEMMRI